MFDVAIVGSGFAGSILARALASRGLEVLLLEKGRHPRFSLGESSTPLASLALERLARDYQLDDLRDLATYGRWSAAHADLGRGLKRGFSFWSHQLDKSFDAGTGNRNRLLVAASPDDRLADSHWLRSDIDCYLVAKAGAEGVDVRQETEVLSVAPKSDGFVLALRGALRGATSQETVKARFVVDGSGRSGVVAGSLGSSLRSDPARFASSLTFGHFDGVEPLADLVKNVETGPYPDEQAAVHHLLNEGWLYSLRFDDGLVSAGLIWINETEDPHPAWAGTTPGELWRHVLGSYPTLRDQFAGARPVRPVERVPRMQYRRQRASGPGWALLPHTYAFFDPLFSTGIAWSLLAVERLARLLSTPERETSAYGALLEREADQIERLIEGAYTSRSLPRLFFAHSQLYFAAVSFQEVSQRMLADQRDDWCWSGFLGAGDRDLEELFAEAGRRLGGATVSESASEFETWVRDAIGPWNVAGLANPAHHNLYPVDLELIIERSALLGLDPREARRRLPLLRGDS